MALNFNLRLLFTGIMIVYFKFTPGNSQLLMSAREMRVEKFQECPNSENLALSYSDILITQSNQNAIELSAKVNIKEVLGTHPVQLSMELQQCASRDDSATCEYYTKIKVKDCCETPLFTTFMKDTTLPSCPVKPATYYYNKARFNLSDVRFLPLFDAYWKIKSILTEEKKCLISLTAAFSLLYNKLCFSK